ncbi:uncharacterized protein VK521_011578 [Ammospiza maritima maritima]
MSSPSSPLRDRGWERRDPSGSAGAAGVNAARPPGGGAARALTAGACALSARGRGRARSCCRCRPLRPSPPRHLRSAPFPCPRHGVRPPPDGRTGGPRRASMALVTVQRSPTPSATSSPCASEADSGEEECRSQPRSSHKINS